jgi:uridine kinase
MGPFLIGMAGGSASGKTSISELIIKSLNDPSAVLISMDSFYKVLTKEQSQRAFKQEYDFDHPDAFDHEILIQSLRELKNGRKVSIPIYDFVTHSRSSKSIVIDECKIVIFEGIFALHDPRVMELLDLKIFVDTDDDIRLSRRCLVYYI